MGWGGEPPECCNLEVCRVAMEQAAPVLSMASTPGDLQIILPRVLGDPAHGNWPSPLYPTQEAPQESFGGLVTLGLAIAQAWPPGGTAEGGWSGILPNSWPQHPPPMQMLTGSGSAALVSGVSGAFHPGPHLLCGSCPGCF